MLNKTSLLQRGAHTGDIPILPLVNTGKLPKGPVKQFFLSVPFGERTQINSDIENVRSIELQQLVVEGINGSALASGVLALEFEHGTACLSAQTEHNLNNVGGNCIIFYYTDSPAKTGVVSFAGDPIVLWQNRGTKDLRHTGRLTLKRISDGEPLTYTNINMWLLMNTNTWQ